MSRHIPDADRSGVTTQGIPITTRTRLLHQNFVSIESKKELRNQVAIENNSL